MSDTFYNGINKQVQIGPESTYGIQATPDTIINYSSESLKLTVDKKEENTLMISKFAKALNVKGYSVSGDIALLLKPENLNILKYGFYESSNPTTVVSGMVYKHTLVALPQGISQSTASILVNEGPSVSAYTGLVVDSFKFEGKANEEISTTASFKGYSQIDNCTLASGLTIPSLKTFGALNGTVTISGLAFDGMIKSASLEFGTGLDSPSATYGSGLYNIEPLHGEKTGKITLDVYYSDNADLVRKQFAKQDTYVSTQITWQSPSLITTGYPYKIQFNMPCVSITDSNTSISSKDRLTATITGNVTENDGSEPLVIYVWDNVSTKY